MSIVCKTVPTVSTSVKDDKGRILLNYYVSSSSGAPSHILKVKETPTDSLKIMSNSGQVYIFVLKTKITNSPAKMYTANDMLMLKGVRGNKDWYIQKLGTIQQKDENEKQVLLLLTNWAHSLDEASYNEIYKNSDYTICAYWARSNRIQFYYTINDIAELKRNLKITITSTGQSGLKEITDTTKNNFANGFFKDAGYYRANKLYINDEEYIGANETVMTFGPNNLDDTINKIKNYSNSTVYQLKNKGDNDVHYTLVKNLSYDQGYDPSSGGAGGDGYWNNSTTIQTNNYVTFKDSGSSITKLNYVQNFNTYKLTFVPCKDSRVTIQDVYPERTILKLQTYSGTKLEKDNVQYYETTDNTLYAVIPEEKVPSTAKIVDTIEPLSRDFQVSIDKETFFTTLDNFFHYSKGNYIWSEDGSRFPGLGTNLEDKFISVSRDGYRYCKHRLPSMCCVITQHNLSEFEGRTPREILTQLTNDNISFNDYFSMDAVYKPNYNFYYFDLTLDTTPHTIEEDNIIISLSENYSFTNFIKSINSSLEICTHKDYTIELNICQERGQLNLYSCELIEAYTRGHDFIQEDYTQVRTQELIENSLNENIRAMEFDENYFTYKYSGREFDIFQRKDKSKCFNLNGIYCAAVHECDLLLESDVTLGNTYGCQEYFIEAIKYPKIINNKKSNEFLYKDTFKITDYIKAIDDTQYVDEDIEILTGKIDLLQCQYYDATKATYQNGWCDCCYGSDNYDKECIYQKLGECPYRFVTEKHPRRLRTLQQSKSNRFNLIQEASKVFEIYPYFYIEYDNTGKVKLDENGRMKKHILYMTEKGIEQQVGFRYEKNLSNITRNIDSAAITTKLFVQSVDSDLSETGVCNIQTAQDNLGKNSYIMDFSYYTQKGLLNPEQVQRDIYGIENGDFAFLPTIDSYNSIYDKYTNLIINLTNEEMITLKAKIDVSVTGVSTALEERKKISQRMYQFKKSSLNRQNVYSTSIDEETIITSDTYKNYIIKYREQAIILWGLIEDLFFTNSYFTYYSNNKIININLDTLDFSDDISSLPSSINGISNSDLQKFKNTYCKGEFFWRLMLEGFEDSNYVPPYTSWTDFKEKVIDKNNYEINGWIGKYQSMLNQVKYWKTERAKILNKINDISNIFYKKYEPFIKEGTWNDNNYLKDNDYYWAAVSVLDDSCKPKVTYNITVSDISSIEEYSDDYKFSLADTTYIEDIDFFDINKNTGLPNRQKIMITEITYSLDEPKENSIKIQNYSTSFDDLFGSISAAVQSLTYNENTYKRASNFTAKQYIQTDSLQGTLDQGDLTLINSNNDNITLDDSGTQGNGINNSSSEYKLSGEGLYFSTDGGETWDQGVGPQGINADYIKFGQLDSSKIQIVDGEYIYFLWDKSGINAYRNPATSTSGLVDFARFNKYGLSLIENNHVRLRAGYEFKTTENGLNPTGNYQDELPLTDQNVGFYLYNDTGKPIFKTETRSEYKNTGEDYSARLSLKGEIFATNANLEGENTGQLMDAVYGKKLSSGYKIDKTNMNLLYSSAYAQGMVLNDSNSKFFVDIDQAQYAGDSITVTPIYEEFEDGENNIYMYTYSFILVINGIIKDLQGDLGVCLDKETGIISEIINKNYKEGDQSIYTIKIKKISTELIDDMDKTFYITENWEEFIPKEEYIDDEENVFQMDSETYTDSKKCYSEDNQYYQLSNEIVNIASEYEPTAEYILADQTFAYKEIEFLTQDNISKDKYVFTKMNLIEELGTYNDKKYNYWGALSDSNTIIPIVSTDVTTKEVGIFINNKTSLDDTLEEKIIDTNNNNNNNDNNQDNSNIQSRAVRAISNNPFDLDKGQFCYCGDSITEALMLSIGDPFIGVGSMGMSNYGGKYSYSSEQLSRIRNATSVAFNFGYNDVGYNYTADQISSIYSQAILQILGDKAVTQNIYIVSIKYTQPKPSDTSVTQSKAKEFNQNLKEAVQKEAFKNSLGKYSNAAIYYVDIWDTTVDAMKNCTGIHGANSQQLYNGIYAGFKNVVGGGGQGAPSDADLINPSVTVTEEMRIVQRGAERMFSIAMVGSQNGEKVYKNILSVLKNGALYIGGEITGEYGQELNLTSLGYLPDKIRINDPGIILGNNGSIWCHWDRFFQIDDSGNLTDRSLENALKAISSSGGSSSINLAPGYYLIDPLN